GGTVAAGADARRCGAVGRSLRAADPETGRHVVDAGPYGRDGLPNRVFAGLYAGQGFHVILQSTRGTFGSEGAFEPGR
ncbi:CocE/NonD family hydrolase, partial [Acinetobacter baumannii]